MATLFDSASLALIPSGVKDGKLYSIKPTDGSGDFTFSRGTDTATRVNSSGLIEKERSNQLLQSNTFSNAAWTQSNTTLTSGQSGYDGSSDAWKVEATTNGTTRLQQTTSIAANTLVTMSSYAKVGNVDFIKFNLATSGTNSIVTFDLTDGTTYSSNAIDEKWESVGGGWVRVSATFLNSNIITEPRIEVRSSSNNATADAGSFIYIQDAQLEYGLVATAPAIETTTAAVYEGITDNLPRLDYSGGASCPSLLLEGSRTNLVAQSEYFGGSYWAGSGSVVSNSAISPSGYQDASTNNPTGIYPSTTGIGDATITNTASIFAKANPSGASVLQFGINRYGTGDGIICSFDLLAGTKGTPVTSGTASGAIADIENYGNGWYRCSITGIASTTAGSLSFNPVNDCFIWGAQLEAGSYVTSIIPTYGTSASRAADSCVKTGISDLIGQTEGTMFVELTRDELEAYTQRVLTLSDGTTSNIIGIQLAQANSLVFYVENGGVNQVVISKSSATTANQKVKIAAAYANNDFVFYVDGVQVGSDSSGSVPSTSQIKFNRPTGGTPFIGDLHQVLLFKTRLTNAELAALTTI